MQSNSAGTDRERAWRDSLEFFARDGDAPRILPLRSIPESQESRAGLSVIIARRQERTDSMWRHARRMVAQIANIWMEVAGRGTPPTRLLDFGCGTGTIAASLARHWGMSRDAVVGTDLSFEPSEVDEAVTRLLPDELNCQQVALRQEFDLVLCNMVLHHVACLESVSAQLQALCGRNGMLLVREHDAHSPGTVDAITMIHDVFEAAARERSERANMLPDVTASKNAGDRDFAIHRLWPKSRWVAWWEAAGWTVVWLGPRQDSPDAPFHALLRPSAHTTHPPLRASFPWEKTGRWLVDGRASRRLQERLVATIGDTALTALDVLHHLEEVPGVETMIFGGAVRRAVSSHEVLDACVDLDIFCWTGDAAASSAQQRELDTRVNALLADYGIRVEHHWHGVNRTRTGRGDIDLTPLFTQLGEHGERNFGRHWEDDRDDFDFTVNTLCYHPRTGRFFAPDLTCWTDVHDKIARVSGWNLRHLQPLARYRALTACGYRPIDDRTRTYFEPGQDAFRVELLSSGGETAELDDVHRAGHVFFENEAAISLFGLPPKDWYAQGIRIAKRTCIECVVDSAMEELCDSLAPHLPESAIVIDLFSGSGNAFWHIHGSVRNATRGFTVEVDQSLAALLASNLAHSTRPEADIHVRCDDWRGGLRSIQRQIEDDPHSPLVILVCPPWGEAFSFEKGLDLDYTTPPVGGVIEQARRMFPDRELHFLVQLHELTVPQSIDHITAKSPDAHRIAFSTCLPPGTNVGLLHVRCGAPSSKTTTKHW